MSTPPMVSPLTADESVELLDLWQQEGLTLTKDELATHYACLQFNSLRKDDASLRGELERLRATKRDTGER